MDKVVELLAQGGLWDRTFQFGEVRLIDNPLRMLLQKKGALPALRALRAKIEARVPHFNKRGAVCWHCKLMERVEAELNNNYAPPLPWKKGRRPPPAFGKEVQIFEC